MVCGDPTAMAEAPAARWLAREQPFPCVEPRGKYVLQLLKSMLSHCYARVLPSGAARTFCGLQSRSEREPKFLQWECDWRQKCMTLASLQVLADFCGFRVEWDMGLLIALLPKSVARDQKHNVWYKWMRGITKCYVWSEENRLALICYKLTSVPELNHSSMFK